MKIENIICLITIFFMINGNINFYLEVFIYKIYLNTFEYSLLNGIILPFLFLLFSVFSINNLKIPKEYFLDIIYVFIRIFKNYFKY